MKIGVILPLGEMEESGAPMPYPTIRGLGQDAEAAGLDSVWVYDHLFYHFEGQEPQGVWEGWTIGSALAEATERVEIGTLVLCTAFRNPAVLAKMAVTLDEVSGQRLILGIGAGWHKPEFDAFGLDFSHLVDQFEEATSIIAPLIRDGSVDFQGAYHQANNCQMLPAPQRRIPLLIAGSKPRMLGLTARFADAWNTCWVGHASAIDDRVAKLRAACEAEGRDPATLEVTVGINVAFPELGEPPEAAADPQKFISGSVEEVASALREYRERGVGHLIAILSPLSADAVKLYGQAAEMARA